MSKNKDITIDEVFKIAVSNHAQNKLKEAQILYNKILEVNPNHSQVLNNFGTIFYNLEENQKAKNYYEKAIKINPKYSNAYLNLGVLFEKLKDDLKAKDCYEKLIENDPNHAQAQNNLGVLLEKLKETQKAKDCYEKAIQLNPNYAIALTNLGIIVSKMQEYQKGIHFFERSAKIDANNIINHNNLGLIYKKLGNFSKALIHFDKSIKIDPNNQELINNLTDIFSYINIDNIIDKNISYLKELFLILFKNKNIYHKLIANNVITFLFKISNYNQINNILELKSSLLKNEIIQKLINEELLHLMLQKSLFKNKVLETLFTKLRSEILSTLNYSKKDFLKQYLDFIISLAEQCWLNEYVYSQTEKETQDLIKLKDKIENENEINELEVAILGCYMPLNKSKIITNKLLNYKSENILFNDLVTIQIKEPLKELELKKSIKSIDKIIDPISKKVQAQYEEHPYPRWRFTNKILVQNFTTWLDAEIEPNTVIHNNNFINPNVLIAGCGTGYHTLSAAKHENANILAVDLSLTSLAYSKRKTEELGFNNIEYLHADILHLKKLNRKFDIIESAGTLHHMKDPLAGLKILSDMLEPHGFMKIGLYSELARKSIVKAREFIKKNNFNNTAEDIKSCRQLLINKKEDHLLQELVESIDFYSTSSVRDLLFHVQEHRFTIPQISKILKDFDLEFLGFHFPNPLIKQKFSKLFPDDVDNKLLDNWHKFEEKNPNTFNNMYQFWVRKYHK